MQGTCNDRLVGGLEGTWKLLATRCEQAEPTAPYIRELYMTLGDDDIFEASRGHRCHCRTDSLIDVHHV